MRRKKRCAVQDGGRVLMGIRKNQGLIPQVLVAVFQCKLHKMQMSLLLRGKRWSEQKRSPAILVMTVVGKVHLLNTKSQVKITW